MSSPMFGRAGGGGVTADGGGGGGSTSGSTISSFGLTSAVSFSAFNGDNNAEGGNLTDSAAAADVYVHLPIRNNSAI